MTNGDKIRSMSDKELAEFFEIMLDQERDDWSPMGCYNCCCYGTHHQGDGTCDACKWKDGIEDWVKRKS